MQNEIILASVFKDAATHLEVAGIISHHLSNTTDVRDVALSGLDFSNCRQVLDLGCGFGFFTHAMIDRLSPGTRISGIDQYEEYRSYYLDCQWKEGVDVDFQGGGAGMLRKYAERSVDAIICSYALYFFPGMIGEIARVLKPEGVFVTITHTRPHMHEFIGYIRNLLRRNGIAKCEELPYELLITNFSDENGKELLGKWFGIIDEKSYQNKLVFKSGDLEDFIKYFEYKKSFFLPLTCQFDLEISDLVFQEVKTDLENGSEFSITKDDVIYVCREPNVADEV